jgi:hypothetical protein
MVETFSSGSGWGPGLGNRPAYSTSHFFAPPLSPPASTAGCSSGIGQAQRGNAGPGQAAKDGVGQLQGFPRARVSGQPILGEVGGPILRRSSANPVVWQ